MSSSILQRALFACAAIVIGLITVFSTVVPTYAAAPNAGPTAPGIFAPAPPGAKPAAPADGAPTEDIRDIRGPKGIFPAWLVPALLAAAVLLAIGGYAAWRWRRRQRPARALLPFEIALRRLEAIRNLMHPSSVREFSIAISDIVRQYIEAGFGITATHRTTEEFLRDLLESSNASLAVHRKLLAQFLDQCDVAKFAGVSLSTQIMESLYQSARSFVVETSKPADNRDPGGVAGSSARLGTSSAPLTAATAPAAPQRTRSGGS
jgi:Domain of unknown function (DUF4381)